MIRKTVTKFVAASLLVCAWQAPVRAEQPDCDTPANLTNLGVSLPRMAEKLDRNEPVTIVAIGSSSTWGAMASSRDASYPSRLQVELRQIFGRKNITVINQGVGGEEVSDMVKRMDEVNKVAPALALWQVGTNAVMREKDLDSKQMLAGINKMANADVVKKIAKTDVVRINPQFAPKVIDKPNALKAVELISDVAKKAGVGLSDRFGYMRRWKYVKNIPFEGFISPDDFHMNDWGYACMAKNVAAGIDTGVASALRPSQAQIVPRGVAFGQ